MLEELRKKSSGIKEAYAFWGAFVVTSLVASVWSIAVIFQFSKAGPSPIVENQAESSGAAAQFFGQLKSNILDTWQQNKEAFNAISEAETATVGTSTEIEAETSSTTPTVPEPSSVQIDTPSGRSIQIATSSPPER